MNACGLLALALAAGLAPGAGSRQLVVVITDGWDQTRGELHRFERTGRSWQRAGAKVEVVLGRSGLAWGAGVHPPSARAAGEPEKREGDGRSPAGAFRLLEATGDAEAPPPGVSLRYRQATPALRCVDDPAARDYNQLVLVPDGGAPPFHSAEEMRRTDGLYAFTIVVEHNRAPAVPEKGSCIFLHVWAGPDTPTAGCTAMARAELEALLVWLRARASPLYVALPRAVYRRVAGAWLLPALP